MWGVHVKSKMAEQEGKRLIDCIKKMGFLQFMPLYLFEFHPIEFHGEKKHTAKILGIYLSELGKKTRNYPPINVRIKWSLGPFERFIARNTLLCWHLPSEMVSYIWNKRLKNKEQSLLQEYHWFPSDLCWELGENEGL